MSISKNAEGHPLAMCFEMKFPPCPVFLFNWFHLSKNAKGSRQSGRSILNVKVTIENTCIRFY